MPHASSELSAFHTLARETPSTRAIASPERNSPSASMRNAGKVNAFMGSYRIVDKRRREETGLGSSCAGKKKRAAQARGQTQRARAQAARNARASVGGIREQHAARRRFSAHGVRRRAHRH